VEKVSWRNVTVKLKDRRKKYNNQNHKTARENHFINTKHTTVDFEIYTVLTVRLLDTDGAYPPNFVVLRIVFY